MIPLRLWGDVDGKNTFGIDFPRWTDVYVLSSDTPITVNFPSGARNVLFSCNADFYVCANGTASIPTTNITDGSGSELNPTIRYINQFTSVSVIAPADCILTCNYYL